MLSTLDKGVSISEIVQITKQSKKAVSNAVEELLLYGLIKEKDKKYFSTGKTFIYPKSLIIIYIIDETGC